MEQQNLIEEFCRARDHLVATLTEKVEVFMTGMWDPLIRHVIVKETEDIIKKELTKLFPDLPVQYFPQCKFRLFDEDENYCIEVGVQNYLNLEKDLLFLGTNDIGGVNYDYYMRESWDPRSKYMFTARYGHAEENAYSGAKTAEAEYYMGTLTPLSVAYGMAVEDGFIS